MHRLRLITPLLWLPLTALAQPQAALAPTASQQQVNPFAALAPPAPSAAPAPAPKPAPLPLPLPLPLPQPMPPVNAGAAPLPPGLRAILIRDNGLGLLGSDDTNALSIAVANGKPVRIAGQDYQAEVDATVIRLYAGPKGRLVWEGSLGSPAPISAPLDISQLRFVPPLSAGVGPGLKSDAARATTAEPMVTRSSD